MMKKAAYLALALTLTLSLCMAGAVAQADKYGGVFTAFDQRDTWEKATDIAFNDGHVAITGTGALADGCVVFITEPGTYVLSGTCANGQIVVDVTKEEKVQLVLNGLTLTCADSAPLYVYAADKVSLTLAPGTVNTFADAPAYTAPFDKMPNACVCARDDLTINGQGALVVNAVFNNGIGCKNDLKIISGDITVTAVNNGLKGNDSIAIKGGNIKVDSKDDGIKTDNEAESDKGYIYIAGGNLHITALDDAIQAVSDVTVTGASVTVNCGGRTINCDGTENVDAGCITAE